MYVCMQFDCQEDTEAIKSTGKNAIAIVTHIICTYIRSVGKFFCAEN